MSLKIELQRELEDSGVVACRDDASKVARIENLSRCWVNAAARGKEGVEVADRISEVRVIEQIEELSAKFDIARFGQRKELSERKIHIHLSRTAQAVPADVSDICAHCAGYRRATGVGNWLADLHRRPGKDRRIEECTCGHILICVVATHSWHQAGTSEGVRSLVQSEQGTRSCVHDIDGKAGHRRNNGRRTPVPRC